MTEILRFEMNVPSEIVLKHAGPGKPIEGRYGNRVMYTLTDDRIMYVAPIVASRITELGIQPGERFQVRKQLRKQGSRRLIEWDVQRVTSEAKTQLEHELRESIAIAQNANAAKSLEVNDESNPQPIPLEPSATFDASPTTAVVPGTTDASERNAFPAHRNGNSQTETESENTVKTASSANPANAEIIGTQHSVAPRNPNPNPSIVTVSNGPAIGAPSSHQRNGNTSPPVTTKLEHALKTAISAAYNAEKYGAELGYVVRFDADAIKSMAITVLINMSEGGRR